MSIDVPIVSSSVNEPLGANLAGLLPPAPARILLLSDLPGAVLVQLQTMGHTVNTYALCDEHAVAQPSSATRQAIFQVNIPAPASDAGGFDAAVVVGLTPQVHPLALWDQLAYWLADGATVILLNKGGQTADARMPHWLDHVEAIGLRCGFVAVAEVEDSGSVSSASATVQRTFKRSGTTRWQVRHVREADFDEIATLFQEVFGHPLSRELWSWKYANGHGNAVVAARNGALIAHYGGMYRDVMLCGRPDWVFQICDVMVHPLERGVMTRQGPFLLTAATSAEIYGPLGFGFPNSRAMQVAEKMGLYSEVGQMASVRWEPSAPSFRWGTRVRSVIRGSEKDRDHIHALWAAMANDLREGVVGARDADYVEHRYFCHPHNHYEVFLVTSRLTGRRIGAFVMRRDGEACEMLDVIAPLDHLPQVIDQARRLVGLWGFKSLYCWITKNHAYRFVNCGGTQDELNISIPTSCWTDDRRADVFKDKWWLMSGDTDFR